jgi:hypothetical protein
MDTRTRQKSPTVQPKRRGERAGGSRRRGMRPLTIITAAPSVALLTLAGAWTFSNSVCAFGPAAPLEQTSSISYLKNFPETSESPTARQPLVLRGISGEALATSVQDAKVAFAVSSKAPTVLVATGPISVGDQVVMSPSANAGFRLASAPATPVEGRPCADTQPPVADGPVADYALVFARRPASANGASLEQASLRAEWRAVVESLILTTEPEPTAVHNL